MMSSAKPLAVDLFCGLGGWTEGLLAEGYDVVYGDSTLRQAELWRNLAASLTRKILKQAMSEDIASHVSARVRPKASGAPLNAALNSQEASVQSTLGSFYAEDHLREKALAHADAALALAPTDAWVLADLAETYEHLGDRKRAIQYAHDSLKNGYTLTDLQRRPGLSGLLADPGFRTSGKQ